MQQPNPSRHRPRGSLGAAFLTVALVMLAGAALSACGGSSSGSSTATTTASTASASVGGSGSAATGPSGTGAHGDGAGPGAGGPRLGRFKALRECLQKNGVTLPRRQGGFLGGAQLPAGVSREQLQAAVKKCGGAPFLGAGRPIRTPGLEQTLTKFAACMRENGVNVPAPNTSGKGPIFNTAGIDTTSAQFRTAESKCRSLLQGSFRRGASGGGPPPGAG